MTALIAVERCTGRSECRTPDSPCIIYVEHPAAFINGDVVIAISGDTTQLGIAIETVTSGSVGDQSEKSVTSEVVDPGERGLGGLDYVLSLLIVEISVFHVWLLFVNYSTIADVLDYTGSKFKMQ